MTRKRLSAMGLALFPQRLKAGFSESVTARLKARPSEAGYIISSAALAIGE